MKVRKTLTYIFIGLVFLGGLFLRTSNLRKRVDFNWDQETTAEAVYGIVKNKKPLLIGPRVGPAKFFLGPGYYYLALPFLLAARFDPIGLYYLSAALSLANGLVFYFVVNKIFNQKTAIVGLLFYFFPPLIVTFDMIPWNVNFLFSASLLTFYGLYKVFIDKENDLLDYILLGVGVGLGLQAHFTAVFFALILIFLIVIKKKFPKRLLLTFVIIFLFILPLLIFELRHDFLNTRHIIEFFQLNSAVYHDMNYFKRTWRNFRIIVELGGKMLVPEPLSFKAKMFFGFSLIFYVLKEAYFPENVRKKLYRLIFLFLLLPLVFISFYKGLIPEYYFFIQVPLLIILLADLLVNVFKIIKRPYFLAIAIVWLYLLLKPSYIQAFFVSNESLYFKQQTVDYVISLSKSKEFKVRYIMATGSDVGFNYLFKLKGKIPKDGAEQEFIVVHPFIPQFKREYFVYYPDVPGKETEEYETFGAYGVRRPEYMK
jgi:4-amino-4-deoxy-L-arabinose transferase-like glycosyltransferase